MICVVTDPPDLANFVELHNLITNKKGQCEGKNAVSMLSWADFSGMAKGEKLYLLAHADGVKVEDLTPTALAIELLKRKVPGHIDSVKLVACLTAMKQLTDDTGTKDVTPICALLAGALNLKSDGKVKVPVTGFTGFAVTSDAGKTRAIDDDKMDKKSKEYAAIFAKWDKDIKTWEHKATTMPTDTAEKLTKSAEAMAQASAAFFEELYEFNKGVVKSKADSKIKATP